jgi:ABC-type protease/lipase transport system fused ATPase/permease subunit
MSDQALRNAEVASVLGMSSTLRDRWMAQQQEALEAQTLATDRGGFASAGSRTLRLMFQSGILALGALPCDPAGDFAGRDDRGFDHHVACAGTGRAGGRALAALHQFPHGLAPAVDADAAHAGEGRSDAAAGADRPADRRRAVCIRPEGDKPLVYNISFDVPRGAGLGIIGPTGAGKSTLARALVGVWPKIRGKVQLDGADIRQWDPDVLGRHIGYLPQDVELFDGTIAENISRFTPDANPETIVSAARQAAVHDMIVRLPGGYNTVVGTGGHRLSAGQLQRVGLARAMYGDPAIMILDEPNANLDAEGEAALVQAVSNARSRGGTVIIVAHRPSALAAIDTLLMLKEGQQVAFGPKDEVLAQVLQGRGQGRSAAANDADAAAVSAARRKAAGAAQPGALIGTSANLSVVPNRDKDA